MTLTNSNGVGCVRPDSSSAGGARPRLPGTWASSAQSVGRWYAAWQAQGTDGLRKAGRAGRKPRLDADQLEQIEHALREGPQALGYDTPLWTAARVADLIERRTPRPVLIRIDIYRLLQQLGWSCQRPVGRALERNERAIRHWKRQRWPAIKKKPLPKAG